MEADSAPPNLHINLTTSPTMSSPHHSTAQRIPTDRSNASNIPSSNRTLKRSDSTYSLSSLPELRNLSVPLQQLPTSMQPTMDSDSVPHLQRTITAQLADDLLNDPTYSKVSQKVKLALFKALDDIEENYQLSKNLPNEQPRPLAIDILSDQIQSFAENINTRLTSLTEELNNLKTNASAQYPPTETTTSYATALKNTKKTRPIVLVSKTGIPTKQVYKNLVKEPCPTEVTLRNVRTRPNYLELTAANQQQSEILKSHVKDHFPDLKVEDKRIPSTRLVFHNASQYTEDQFHKVLLDHGFEKEEIRFVTSLKSKNTDFDHWVIDLPKSKTHQILLKNYNPSRPSFILIGLRRLYFKLHVRLQRCRKCQGLDHTTAHCTNTEYCANCGGEHEDRECKERSYCVNCADFNTLVNISDEAFRNPYHPASSSDCPTYRAKLLELMTNPHPEPPLPDVQEQKRYGLRPRRLN